MALALRWVAGAAALCAFAPAVASAQTGFEGTMTFVTRDATGANVDTMVQTVKGKNMRMAGGRRGNNAGGSMIIDADKKRMIMIDDKEHAAMIFSMDDQAKLQGLAAKSPKPAAGTTRPSSPPAKSGLTITKTGRTEVVAGVKCEVYHASSANKADGESDVCLADGVGFALMPALGSMPMLRASNPRELGDFGKVMTAGKGLVKATTTRNGQSYVSLEMVKVDRKGVPASAFEPPAGYQVRNMSDAISQLQNSLQQMQQGKKVKPPR